MTWTVANIKNNANSDNLNNDGDDEDDDNGDVVVVVVDDDDDDDDNCAFLEGVIIVISTNVRYLMLTFQLL